jgi:hypothetical protein
LPKLSSGDTRVIIACAGRVPDLKWNNYLGVPKHLVPVNGVPLLHRTVEQFWDADETYIIHPPGQFSAYHVADAIMVEADGENEYVNSQPWWNPNGRTILLLGDVYFSATAVVRIMAEKRNQVTWFGRFGASKVTGTRYGEIFAVSWTWVQHPMLGKHLLRVINSPTIKRPPGWKLYRSIHGGDMGTHRYFGLQTWTEINDETDDFDFPKDYERHPAVRRGR